MNGHDKVVRYLQQRAGTEQTIADALNMPSAEVFQLLTVLLENDQIELYQSQSGDEMYRSATRVHLEAPRKRPNTATTWGTPMHLESIWPSVVTDTDPFPGSIYDEVPGSENFKLLEEISIVEEPPEPKPAKKLRQPKKRRNMPFTPLSWDQKELPDEQYADAYYKPL